MPTRAAGLSGAWGILIAAAMAAGSNAYLEADFSFTAAISEVDISSCGFALLVPEGRNSLTMLLVLGERGQGSTQAMVDIRPPCPTWDQRITFCVEQDNLEERTWAARHVPVHTGQPTGLELLGTCFTM